MSDWQSYLVQRPTDDKSDNARIVGHCTMLHYHIIDCIRPVTSILMHNIMAVFSGTSVKKLFPKDTNTYQQATVVLYQAFHLSYGLVVYEIPYWYTDYGVIIK